MLDFMTVAAHTVKKGTVEIRPDFQVISSNDLMTRGGDFYAIWDEDRQVWSTDEQDAVRLIDREIDIFANQYKSTSSDTVKVLKMRNASSRLIKDWHRYVKDDLRQNYHPLDEKLIFSDTAPNKKDYASKSLPYPLKQGDTPAWDELMGTLYSPAERKKIEWAIGAVVSGDSKKIQKFVVMYGPPASGKSTVLNIIQDLFDGYYCVFDSRALGSANSSFALEPFAKNPLVAIQQDGDLSKIEDNTRLNSLVSHEEMVVNEKYSKTYPMRFNCFLFMGTNKPVRITDSKSGIIRRLIDIRPTGNKIPRSRYDQLIEDVRFELGAIAYHCLEVYKLNRHFYDDYIPVDMLGASNDFYNYILDSYDTFKASDSTTMKQAWEMYKTYNEEARVLYPYPQRQFKEELKSYFAEFIERYTSETGERFRNYYSGFLADKFVNDILATPLEPTSPQFKLESTESLLDDILAEEKAQYGDTTKNGIPSYKWENVTTTLKDIDTTKLHYVKVPQNHIVIDFDIKDENGNKSFALNAAEAAKFKPTYAELSKSGQGIHLHYIYDGDVSKLSRIYSDDIEIKVFTGNMSLRRKLTKCNDIPIATISSGLPLKEDTKVINYEGLKNEKALRTLIRKNLNKEYHNATKPSIDFIASELDKAYESGMEYDISDLKPAILDFAANSTNQSDYCIKKALSMNYKSEHTPEDNYISADTNTIIFYDVEVFSNLLIVCFKPLGSTAPPVQLINPSPSDIERLLKYRLVGFNNRRYDNHILYARLIGYSTEQIFEVSQRIINNSDGFFGEAYNLSYTDIYDYAAKKQSLKKWEYALGIIHRENSIPWDKPAPKDKWQEIADYCSNDVIATEAVWNVTQGDFTARKILASLAGMSANSTTNMLTTKIIFGNEKHPQLVYTDLSKEFPGYEFVRAAESLDKKKHNMYRGVDLGFGGYVYAQPGIYHNVALLDVALFEELKSRDKTFNPEFANYEVFNKNIVYARENDSFGEDVKKYFAYVKSKGYSGVIDYNDKYGRGLGTKAPVIFFGGNENFNKKSINRLTDDDYLKAIEAVYRALSRKDIENIFPGALGAGSFYSAIALAAIGGMDASAKKAVEESQKSEVAQKNGQYSNLNKKA